MPDLFCQIIWIKKGSGFCRSVSRAKLAYIKVSDFHDNPTNGLLNDLLCPMGQCLADTKLKGPHSPGRRFLLSAPLLTHYDYPPSKPMRLHSPSPGGADRHTNVRICVSSSATNARAAPRSPAASRP